MATTVTFNDLTNPVVTVKSPSYPEEEGRTYTHLIGRTMGGGIKTADMGDGTVHQNPVLHFRDMTNAHYSSLKTFFETTVSFSKTSFTYPDPHAAAHTNMHYLGGIERARSKKGNRWDFDVRLTKDLAA